MNTEPVLITAFVGAVLVLAVTLGAPISEATQNAINAVIIAGCALFARSKVTPTGKS